MDAIDVARAYYRTHGRAGRFNVELDAYMDIGCAVVRKRLFVLGRPVRRDWEMERIVQTTDTPTNPDAWYVHLLVGHPKSALQQMPFFLPFIGFARGDERMRWYDTQRFLNINGLKKIRREQWDSEDLAQK